MSAPLLRLIARALPLALGLILAALPLRAQAPLELTIRSGQIRPIPIAIAPFAGDDAAGEIARIIAADLAGSGLFSLRPAAGPAPAFDVTPDLAAARAAGAEALLIGQVLRESDGRLRAEFRLFDIASGEQVEGQRFFAAPTALRRLAHKTADAVYARLTGEGPYFDSRIVFIAESGPKTKRVKRLAIMDQDGANVRYLTTGAALALTPRFSPRDQELVYLSYETGEPQVFLLDIATGRREALGRFPGMTFAPRFSPDGRQVAISQSVAGNTDIHLIDLASRAARRLTQSPAIDTAPSFSPDGAQIVFESDRGGGQQIYVMSVAGGEATARRISFGSGRYGTPVWSPRGDLIAFTRQSGGRFEIGVMAPDGSGERILYAGYHAEGPTWSPNGRVVSFFVEGGGAGGSAALWAVDVTGAATRRLNTPGAASDPAWSPLLP